MDIKYSKIARLRSQQISPLTLFLTPYQIYFSFTNLFYLIWQAEKKKENLLYILMRYIRLHK